MLKNTGCFLIFFILTLHISAQSSLDSTLLPWDYYRLNNGIRVVLQHDTSQKEISVEFWVGMGSRDEQTGKHGFVHFFQHATPYGLTKDTNDLKAFRLVIKNSNAQTRRDYTRYYVQVSPEGLPITLKYAADRLRADTGKIGPRTIEWHRTNVLNEMKRQESNAFYGPLASAARESATFGPNDPYGHSAYGTIQENESFSGEEVKRWYEQYFFTDNIVLFVVGNFDPNQAKELIQKEFGNITRSGKRPASISNPVVTQANVSIKATLPENFLSLTWPAAPYGSKNAEALQLLAYVLDARLAKEHPKMINKAASSDLLAQYELAGEFGVFASFVNLSDSTQTELYLREAIKDIIVNGISKQELSDAQKQLVSHTLKFNQQLGFAESRTELLGEGLMFANDPGYYYKRLQRQLQMKPKELQKVAAAILGQKSARVLVISDK